MTKCSIKNNVLDKMHYLDDEIHFLGQVINFFVLITILKELIKWIHFLLSLF
jgi:hypothetical protein